MLGPLRSTERYCPVDQLWHADSEDIPTALLKNLNLAAMPKRSGSQKVEALFGVPGRRKKSNHSANRASPASDWRRGVRRGDRAFEADDLSSTADSRPRRANFSRNLRVVVCTAITGEMEFQGSRDSLELNPWDWMLDDETQTAFVQADPNEPDPLRSDLMADAVGQISQRFSESSAETNLHA